MVKAAAVAVAAALGVSGCGQAKPDAVVTAPDGAMAGGTQTPIAKISYQTKTPTSDADYPYTMGMPAADGPAPGETVYLSAEGSFDPDGAPVTFFWNAKDPDGAYLGIDPSPDATRVSFTPTRIGTFTVSLEAIEVGGLTQIGQSVLPIAVGPHACGVDGVSGTCSDELLVPGGTFVAGTPAGLGDDNEVPPHMATVASFYLDAYEVTVGRMRKYIAGYTGIPPEPGAGAHPLVPGSGWNADWNNYLPGSSSDFAFAIAECGGTWTSKAGPSDARPITCVGWYEAFAFCAAEGKRLPTEAEWEFAAAGGAEQRPYPWGDQAPNPTLAVYACLFDGNPACSAVGADLPVAGSLPGGAGRWGHRDLAGSVWEWVLDFYAPYTSAPCDNCSPTATDGLAGRVFRGGGFDNDATFLRSASRLAFTAGYPVNDRGFRCARTAP